MYSSSIYTFGQPMRYVEVGMGRGWDAGSLQPSKVQNSIYCRPVYAHSQHLRNKIVLRI